MSDEHTGAQSPRDLAALQAEAIEEMVRCIGVIRYGGMRFLDATAVRQHVDQLKGRASQPIPTWVDKLKR